MILFTDMGYSTQQYIATGYNSQIIKHKWVSTNEEVVGNPLDGSLPDFSKSGDHVNEGFPWKYEPFGYFVNRICGANQ